MGIHIVRKAELKNVSARYVKPAILINIHYRRNGGTLQTDKPPGEFQEILTKIRGLFGEPIFPNVQKGGQADFETKTDPIGKIHFCSPYRISPREEAERRRQIEKVIGCSPIQPSQSNFDSPVFFVPKPDSTLPLCIDYRAVNTIPVKDRCPLPHIEDLLNSMHGSCWFTQLDSAAAYHQIRIATADRQKTAFTTTFGLYQWQVLPLGLANAPSQFVLMMNGIMEPMKSKFIVVHLEIIVIHRSILAEHVIHVREVLTLLTEHGLKARHAKCAWACQKVDFCGFDIDMDGIHTQEHKTRVVMDWPQPENSKDVGGFLCLTSFHRKFSEQYAHIAIPLYTIGTPPKGKGDVGQRHGELRRIWHTPFSWGRECQHSFDMLQKALYNTPVLALLDPNAKYCLHVDPSQYGFGAVRSEVQDKTEKVLGIFSCKLHDLETRYPAFDRELLRI